MVLKTTSNTKPLFKSGAAPIYCSLVNSLLCVHVHVYACELCTQFKFPKNIVFRVHNKHMYHVETHVLHCIRYSDSEPTIHCDPNAEKSYLSLEELGNVLTGLTSILQCKLPYFARLPHVHSTVTLCTCTPAAGVPIGRSFNTRILKCGHPNLIVTPPGNPRLSRDTTLLCQKCCVCLFSYELECPIHVHSLSALQYDLAFVA